MTAHHPWRAWPLIAAAGARPGVGVVSPAVQRLDPRLDITVALRRCATYRKALRGAAISYPADVLWMEPVATWVRRHGACVDVFSAEELELAVANGIPPRRLVMHRADATARPIRLAVDAGAGRFVVDSAQQIAVLADSARRTQRVLVDVTAQPADALAAEVMAHPRLDLIGLHWRLGGRGDREPAGEMVREMIAQMSWIRHEHGVILTRVSLADAAELCCERSYLRDVSEDLDEALDDACARFRYPRPALVLSISRSALTPVR